MGFYTPPSIEYDFSARGTRSIRRSCFLEQAGILTQRRRDYFADILVEDKVIVETKSIKEINPVHEVATGIEVGLLINFGKSVEIRRKIFRKSE